MAIRTKTISRQGLEAGEVGGVCYPRVPTPCKSLYGSNYTLDNALSNGSANGESDARLVQKSASIPDSGIALGQAPLGESFGRRRYSWLPHATGVCPAALFGGG